MHNLHYVVVGAEDGKGACHTAEWEIMDWGDENNWRSICGAVCKDGTVYETGDGRWTVGDMTVKKIEKLIMDTALESASLNDRAKEIAVKLASGEPLEKLDMYILRKSITEMESAKWLLDGGRKTFKEGMEYRPWELDEFGVTNIFNKDSGKLWVVVVDMHS